MWISLYNQASSDAVASPSCLQMCFDYISVKILRQCDETSLTVTRIAISLTLKWEVALMATFHSTIFHISMGPVRDDQRHRRRFTR